MVADVRLGKVERQAELRGGSLTVYMEILQDPLAGGLHTGPHRKYIESSGITQINFFLIPAVDVSTIVYNNSHMSKRYHWDSIYEIALALKARYPDKDLDNVSLQMIFDWVIALPEFEDDLELANDEILLAIFQEWYEELD